MRILKVIHGYPMRYNAGSEVYSQTLVHALVQRGHQVQVFTREEDPFRPDYSTRVETDPLCPQVKLTLVNMARDRDRYRHVDVDDAFERVLREFRPDVVHIGHLNHLSTSLVLRAADAGVPIVFTLHDYWLMCPRGQFMQTHVLPHEEVWPACDGQQDSKCAQRCYSHTSTGDPARRDADLAKWTEWVSERMAHAREIAEHIDLFIAPSDYLRQRFERDFGLPTTKCKTLDYGFDRSRLGNPLRASGEPYTLGYIGTHIPAKGIHLLLGAFGELQGAPRLRIWGRPRAQHTAALHRVAQALPGDASARIEWCGEYRNPEIVPQVFNRVDAIVVPSVWVENSPLVIHEAQQAGVPVVTADAGGMAELVEHDVNGLCFRFRDAESLAEQMQRLVDDPELGRQLGRRGYLASDDGQVPSVQAHAAEVERMYTEILAKRASSQVPQSSGPWRITFDTNPDDCNLQCVMCEEHSPHSPLQRLRRAQGRPPRRMDIALLERVLAEAAPMGLRELIPSTMGEPLLYKDFERVLELCTHHGVLLNLTTNGTFPRRGALDWARRLVPLTSDVKISWNGATGDTHTRIMIGSKWDQVLDNVRTFIRVRDEHAAAGGNRCRVTFQLTFLETNVHELADVVRLAAELGVDRVKGHHLWAHFHEIENLSMRRDPDAIARWNQAVRDARQAAEEHRLASGVPVLLENIFELEPDAEHDLAPGGRCPFLGQEAWISAQGRFNPCCAPDAERRTLGDFGHLTEQSFSEIWTSDRYQRLVQGYRTRALCQGCTMRKPVETP